MSDEAPQPAPVFPQYQPPVNPNAVQPLGHPKQQKPLFKLINRMLRPRNKPRPAQKRSGRRKRNGV